MACVCLRVSVISYVLNADSGRWADALTSHAAWPRQTAASYKSLLCYSRTQTASPLRMVVVCRKSRRLFPRFVSHGFVTKFLVIAVIYYVRILQRAPFDVTIIATNVCRYQQLLCNILL